MAFERCDDNPAGRTHVVVSATDMPPNVDSVSSFVHIKNGIICAIVKTRHVRTNHPSQKMAQDSSGGGEDRSEGVEDGRERLRIGVEGLEVPARAEDWRTRRPAFFPPSGLTLAAKQLQTFCRAEQSLLLMIVTSAFAGSPCKATSLSYIVRRALRRCESKEQVMYKPAYTWITVSGLLNSFAILASNWGQYSDSLPVNRAVCKR